MAEVVGLDLGWPVGPVVRLRILEDQDLIFKTHPQLSEVCGRLRYGLPVAEANSKLLRCFAVLFLSDRT